MKPLSNVNLVGIDKNIQSICLIVGLACLSSFIVGMFIFGSPPRPMVLEWRFNFLRQVSDRSIIALFGLGLIFLGCVDRRKLAKQLALVALIAGILLNVMNGLVIRDSLVLKNIAVTNITNQSQQFQTQLEANQDNLRLTNGASTEEIEQLAEAIDVRAESAQKNVTQQVNEATLTSISSFLVIGLGFISLGYLGLKIL